MSFFRQSETHYWNTDDVLGSGATCFVYKGISEDAEIRALKVFKNSFSLDLRREEEALKTLSHPNIVTFYGIETELLNRSKVLVMEYCDGGSLFSYLSEPENSYGLEDEEFLTLLSHLTYGLQHLREHGFVHRDIKPGNILRCLDERGRSVYKLSDFGTARPLADSQYFMSLVGTEEYLHPDIYRAAFIDQKDYQFHSCSDLWSLGCTLYHAASGRVPFKPYSGRKDKETMFMMTANKPTNAISGVQLVKGGDIQWHNSLPDTTPLSQGLQGSLCHILAGLLETKPDQMWTYEKYFHEAISLIKQIRVTVLCAVADNQFFRLVYLKPTSSLLSLRDELSNQCAISTSNQCLLFQNDFLSDAQWPTMDKFPITSLAEPLVLLSRQHGRFSNVSPFQTDTVPDFKEPVPNIHTTVEQDFQTAKLLTETIAVMCRKVQVAAHFQQEVMRVRQMFRLHLKVRSQAIERRRLTVHDVLQKLQANLPEESKSYGEFYNQVSNALQWIKDSALMEPATLNKQEKKLEDTSWCFQNGCVAKMEQLLYQAKNLLMEFNKRRNLTRNPNKSSQLMMKRDRRIMYDLNQKAVTLCTEHCCSNTTSLQEILHIWFSCHVDAGNKLDHLEKKVDQLSQQIADQLPSVYKIMSTSSICPIKDNLFSQQIVKQLLHLPVAPANHSLEIAKALDSLESLTRDLPEVFVVGDEKSEAQFSYENARKECFEPPSDITKAGKHTDYEMPKSGESRHVWLSTAAPSVAVWNKYPDPDAEVKTENIDQTTVSNVNAAPIEVSPPPCNLDGKASGMHISEFPSDLENRDLSMDSPVDRKAEPNTDAFDITSIAPDWVYLSTDEI